MSDGVANLFVHGSAARRYAAAWPYFHPRAIQKIAAFTGIDRANAALDVACGTGQSARALAAIADRVEAIDVSEAMLDEAERIERVHYQAAPAEKLPFAEGAFQLLTVGLAFHWFDQSAFLDEARRVLDPGWWLVIYTSGFCGEMQEDAGFRNWAWEIYPKRFPAPPRRSAPIGAELVSPHGFEFRGEEKFTHDERMSAEGLTEYLLTQTNVIAAVESGSTPPAEAAEWIISGISPYFRDAVRTMKFSGTNWYLQQATAGGSVRPAKD